MSCSLREPTASEGNKVARENIQETGLLTYSSNTATTKQNNANHQYSGRLARPLKSAYLAKQALIASVKDIIHPLIIRHRFYLW